MKAPNTGAGADSVEDTGISDIPQLPRVLQDLTVLSPLTTASSKAISSAASIQRSQETARPPSPLPVDSPPSSSPSTNPPPANASPENAPSRSPSTNPSPSTAAPFEPPMDSPIAPTVFPASPQPVESAVSTATPNATPTDWSSIEDLLAQTDGLDQSAVGQSGLGQAGVAQPGPAAPQIQASPAPPPPSVPFSASNSSPAPSVMPTPNAPASSIAEALSPTEAFPDLRPFESGPRSTLGRSDSVIQRQSEAAIAPPAQSLTHRETPDPSTENPESPEEGGTDNEEALEKLAQAIYLQLRQRLAIERERSGRSSPGRLPW